MKFEYLLTCATLIAFRVAPPGTYSTLSAKVSTMSLYLSKYNNNSKFFSKFDTHGNNNLQYF